MAALNQLQDDLQPRTPTLRLNDFRITYRPPSYTERPTRSRYSSSGNIRALPGTEVVIDAYRLLMEVLGAVGPLKGNSPGVALSGRIEQEIRTATINTFGGGVNEIQREIVAMLGLRLPRAPR